MTYSLSRDILEQFLMSDAAPQDSMGSHDLDGFLTGLAAGPETVPFLEWSRIVWGSENPRFSSCSQERLILDLMLERYDELSRALREPAADSAELHCEDCEEQSIVAAAWADGFLQAMELRPEAWLPLVRDGQAGMNLMPLLALDRGLADEYSLPFSPSLMQAMMAATADMIQPCVKRIRRFWDERPDIATPQRREIVSANAKPDRVAFDLRSSRCGQSVAANKSEDKQVRRASPSGNSLGRPCFSDEKSSDFAESGAFRAKNNFKPRMIGDCFLDGVRQLLLKDGARSDDNLDNLEAVMITDDKGIILSTNGYFTRITGYSFDEAVGQTPRMLKSSLTKPEDHGAFWNELATKGRWHGHVWNRARSGDLFYIRQTVTALKDASDKPFGFMSIFRRVTET